MLQSIYKNNFRYIIFFPFNFEWCVSLIIIYELWIILCQNITLSKLIRNQKMYITIISFKLIKETRIIIKSLE